MFAPGRRTGWWGILFVAMLLVVSGMLSLPTAAETGSRINAFYSAHRQLIVIQQVIGALTVIPFMAFVLGLDRSARTAGRDARWLIPSGVLVVITELATNALPAVLALTPAPSDASAHALTLAADIADAALFAAIALFALATSLSGPLWLRALGVAVAILTAVRAVGSPLGMTALDFAAPLAFIVYVVVLSGRVLAARDAAGA